VSEENSCKIFSFKVFNKPPLAHVPFRGYFGLMGRPNLVTVKAMADRNETKETTINHLGPKRLYRTGGQGALPFFRGDPSSNFESPTQWLKTVKYIKFFFLGRPRMDNHLYTIIHREVTAD